jgi:predicted type IV restriction endonuclease
MNIPAKFTKRVNENLKKYQDIVKNLKKKDANEADTVKVITDILESIFGYDKYTEITSEYAIRGTYCDLAIVDGKKIRFLIEAKAVSIALNENHLKQALNYGANAGVSWIILTNSENWVIYKIKFGKPIDTEAVAEFNLLTLDPKNEKDAEVLFIISKDGQEKSSIDDYYAEIQVKNKFIIGALLYNDDVITVIRRNMKRLYADVKITDQEIADIMANDIIKREIIDSDESKKAVKEIAKLMKKLEQSREQSKQTAESESAIEGKPEPEQHADTVENENNQ